MENIVKTHSVLHFNPQTHQKTATVVSARYFFHGKQPQAQKKQKAMSSSRNPRNTRKSEFYYKNHLRAQTNVADKHSVLIERADGPMDAGQQWDRDCGKQSICGNHDPPFSDRVWGLNPQDSNTSHHCYFSDILRGTSCLGFPLGILLIHFITIAVFVICSPFDSPSNKANSTTNSNIYLEKSSIETQEWLIYW